MTSMPTKKNSPKRRPRGTGSAIQKRGIWYGRMREDGKDRIATEGFATEEEALDALDRLIAGAPDPRLLPSLERYWESLVIEGGEFEHAYDSSETINIYETVWALHLRRTPLGIMRIDQVRRVNVQRWMDRLYSKMAASTVRRYASCVSVVFKTAEEAGLIGARLEKGVVIPANPCEGLKFRPLPEPPSYIFSDEELGSYPELLYEYSPRLSAMVTVQSDTGVRPGELCAMRASRIKDGVWIIDDTRQRDGKLKKRTKTGRIRHIALSVDAQSAIAEQGSKGESVWMTEDNTPMRPDGYAQQLRRFRKWLEVRLLKAHVEAGGDPATAPTVPPLTATNLRKTFITRGIESGSGKAVQALAGHANWNTTYNVYAKARKDPQAELIENLSTGIKRNVFRAKKDVGVSRKGPEDVTSSIAEGA